MLFKTKRSIIKGWFINKKTEESNNLEKQKREKLQDLNEQMIVANNEEVALEKQIKEIDTDSHRKKLEKDISEIIKEKKEIQEKSNNIKLKKFKNLFKFKTKYMTLMYSPTRSSLLFRIFIITIAAAIVTFSLHFFVHPGHVLYTGGLRTAQQIILFAANDSIPEWSTYLIFFGMNLPLAYFGWKYIGKWFTILTLYFLVIQSGFDELLNIDYLKNNLSNLAIIKVSDSGQVVSGNASIYISACVGAFLYGLGVALTFVAGASSGGTKFIVAWLQKKFNFSLGKSSIYIALFMISLGLLINGVIIDGKNFIATYLSTTTFATIAFITIQALIQNVLAPRTQKTTINIVTSNIEKVKEVIDSTILSKRVWYTYKIKKNKDKKMSSVVVLTIDKREADFILRKLTRRLPSSQITYYNTNLHSDKYIVRGFD